MFVPFNELDDSSRVWVYQADQELTESQAAAIQSELVQFLAEWTAHNEKLHAFGEVVHRRFITIFVDERFAGTSGCSIDRSVHFLQYLEDKYGIAWMERTQVAYLKEASVNMEEFYHALSVVPLDQLGHLYQQGIIHDQTPVFDNLVQTKESFVKSWLKPLNKSWHHRFVR